MYDLAQTGNPTFAITIDRETVRKKVLFPAIFAPVTIKNS